MFAPQLKNAVQYTLILMALYFGILVHTALFSPVEISQFLFSEQGAFEFFSPWLWCLLAFLCLFQNKWLYSTRIASALAALLFAMREWDLHKTLFETSFIKTNFYRSSDIALGDKLIGGTILLIAVYVLFFLMRRFIQFSREQFNGLTVAGFFVYLTLVCAALSKILDRSISQLNELFGIQVSQQASLLVLSVEESMEMLLPVMLIIALLSFRQVKQLGQGTRKNA